MGYKPVRGEFYKDLDTGEIVEIFAAGPVTVRVKGPQTDKAMVYSKFMKKYVLHKEN